LLKLIVAAGVAEIQFRFLMRFAKPMGIDTYGTSK
jgi:hypothetical protein